MSYAYVVTFGHELADGHWCADCVPAEHREECQYCNPSCATVCLCGDHAAYGESLASCVDPMEATESLDSPAHCKDCGELLDNDLTSEGEEYVRQAITFARAADQWTDVTEQWANRWPELAEDGAA